LVGPRDHSHRSEIQAAHAAGRREGAASGDCHWTHFEIGFFPLLYPSVLSACAMTRTPHSVCDPPTSPIPFFFFLSPGLRVGCSLPLKPLATMCAVLFSFQSASLYSPFSHPPPNPTSPVSLISCWEQVFEIHLQGLLLLAL
jgi:hypothetical protein